MRAARLAAVAILLTSAARAEGSGVLRPDSTPAAPVPALPPPDLADHGSYGGQIFLVDLASLGLFALGFFGDGSVLRGHDVSPVAVSLIGVGALGWFAGGPIVHGLHGHEKAAMASLGLRIAVPLLCGGLAYAASSGGHGEDAGLASLVTGGAVAAVALAVPMAVDALYLARNPWDELGPQASAGPVLQDPSGRRAKGLALGVRF